MPTQPSGSAQPDRPARRRRNTTHLSRIARRVHDLAPHVPYQQALAAAQAASADGALPSPLTVDVIDAAARAVLARLRKSAPTAGPTGASSGRVPVAQLTLGTDQSGLPVTISTRDLDLHMLITGATGYGRSQLLRTVLAEAAGAYPHITVITSDHATDSDSTGALCRTLAERHGYLFTQIGPAGHAEPAPERTWRLEVAEPWPQPSWLVDLQAREDALDRFAVNAAAAGPTRPGSTLLVIDDVDNVGLEATATLLSRARSAGIAVVALVANTLTVWHRRLLDNVNVLAILHQDIGIELAIECGPRVTVPTSAGDVPGAAVAEQLRAGEMILLRSHPEPYAGVVAITPPPPERR